MLALSLSQKIEVNDRQISILIPVYNAEKYIKETLASISSQTYADWECILVDDGSTDGSVDTIREIIASDNRFRLMTRPDDLPKGANVCRNLAFENSFGGWIIWFDADDVMLPTSLYERMMLTNNETDIVITSQLHANANLTITKPFKKYHTTDNLFADYVLWRLEIITGSVMFRRKFISDQPLFVDWLLKSQEAELFSRLFFSVKADRFRLSNVPTFLYRNHTASSTTRNKIYKPDYKRSEIYTVSENLKRGIAIHHLPIVESMYRLLINLLHKAIIHKDSGNIATIINLLESNLGSKNKSLILKLKLTVMIHRLIPFKAIRWDAIFKKFKINL